MSEIKKAQVASRKAKERANLAVLLALVTAGLTVINIAMWLKVMTYLFG